MSIDTSKSHHDEADESTGLLPPNESSKPALRKSCTEYDSIDRLTKSTPNLNKNALLNNEDFDHILNKQPSRSLLAISHNADIRSPILTMTPSSPVDEDRTSSQRPALIRSATCFAELPCSHFHSGNVNVLKPPGPGSERSVNNTVRKRFIRNFYDDFTSVDWVNDTISESKRIHKLNKISGIRGKIVRLVDNATGWILITIVSLVFSLIAYVIDRSESVLVDLKRGYCQSNWLLNEQLCCLNDPANISGNFKECSDWKLWPEVFESNENRYNILKVDFMIYFITSVTLAYIAVKITLTTKTTNPLGNIIQSNRGSKPSRIIYSATGSGVPEVKTILSGFVIRKFLGTYTLIAKSTALIFSIASGMSLGKEGPFVHIAACVGNIFARFFKKFNDSGLERRQILSASASAGVALAFGSPLGGVLFSLEEVSYYLPGNQLFKTFFCAIMSILFLRFLNPYGTGKTVLFELSYSSDWKPIELVLFVIIGVIGGIHGGLFCKFCIWWGEWFRSKSLIKHHPVREVLITAGLTALVTFSNPYTKTAIPELLHDLASPCFSSGDYTGDKGLCPLDFDSIPAEVRLLFIALLIKMILTAITFGIKVPAGIYVPSMVVGALFGRCFAMSIQYMQSRYSTKFLWFDKFCDGTSPCIDFGIYAMISAGAFMAGVTRMNVTLATIMFELTSSYTYVLPISIAIAVSNWVAFAIEPNSLYQLLLTKHEFPFLGNRKLHDLTNSSGIRELIHGIGDSIYIDITNSSIVKFSELKKLLAELQMSGMIDGCIPIIEDSGRFVGTLPAPELEYALDRITKFRAEYGIQNEIFIKLLDTLPNSGLGSSEYNSRQYNNSNQENGISLLNELTDFTGIIEYTPIMLDVNSPLALVEMVFTKLGNRSICVLESGKFIGILYKKVFINYCRER